MWIWVFSFRRHQTDDPGINSPSFWPRAPRLHVRTDGCVRCKVCKFEFRFQYSAGWLIHYSRHFPSIYCLTPFTSFGTSDRDAHVCFVRHWHMPNRLEWHMPNRLELLVCQCFECILICFLRWHTGHNAPWHTMHLHTYKHWCIHSAGILASFSLSCRNHHDHDSWGRSYFYLLNKNR